jgi:sodium-dependent phosphate cotransporter
MPTSPAEDGSRSRESTVRDRFRIPIKIASFLVALFLFILAIQLMKEGAKALAPTLTNSPLFSNPFSTLGAGWLGAYIVLSGSPVAAVALSLYVGGVSTELQTFTMLSGSRLIGMGILALSLTAVVYLPGMVLGFGILRSGILDPIRLSASSDVLSLIDVIWGPVLDALTRLPGWSLLPLGLVIILVSFRLLDSVLPQLDGERQSSSRIEWMKRPWPMFALGCVVATLTLSVSVALTVLVPLASRGYITREESIPYIMGANITTLADTLVAAMLLGDVVAVHIVLAEAIAVSIVSLTYLAFFYGSLRKGVVALDDWVVASSRRLWVFVAVLFVTPALLLTSGIWTAPFGR